MMFDSLYVYQQFGQCVKTQRIRKEMTQGEVANRIGVTQAYYHYIEKGSRKIGFDLILNICSVLDFDLNDFLISLTKTKPPVVRPEDEEKEEGAF